LVFLSGLLAASIIGMIVFRPAKDKPASRVMYYLAMILFLLVITVALSLIAGHPVELG
jgi:hypothetical protein